MTNYTYTVRTGDSCASIAEAYVIPVNQLQTQNKVRPLFGNAQPCVQP